MFDLPTIWKQACAQLQLQLSPAVFSTWILSNPLTDLVAIDDFRVKGVITSPTAFHSAHLQKNLSPIISSVLSNIMNKQVELQFLVGNPVMTSTMTPGSSMPSIGQLVGSAGSVYGVSSPQTQVSTALSSPPPEQPHNYSSPQPTFTPSYTPNSTSSPRVEDLFSPSAIQANAVDRAVVTARTIGLRIDYTFATFAVSTTNEMAHA
ncbi:MAG: hypothetical protein M3Q81_03630, partial [bacterium]|nr:hypothetical protein [bacterium]